MTNEEAIKWLETARVGDEWEYPMEIYVAIDMAIEALEKRIQRKPYFEGDGYFDGELVMDTWICPCCGKCFEVDYEEYDHCTECGQAIDWSEEND